MDHQFELPVGFKETKMVTSDEEFSLIFSSREHIRIINGQNVRDWLSFIYGLNVRNWFEGSLVNKSLPPAMKALSP